MRPDDPIEARLRAWRPCGPAPDLRRRIAAETRPAPARWWYAAAAALLLLTLGLHAATDAMAPPELAADADAAAAARLGAWLGGTPVDRSRATALVATFRTDAMSREAAGRPMPREAEVVAP